MGRLGVMLLLVVFVGGCIWRPPGTPAAVVQTDDVRVMSFNIRYGLARDGENSWRGRREHLVETIRAYNPDVLGTQEVLNFQARFLQEHLPEYGFHGVGREDGVERGEYAAIFYRADRFEVVDAGHQWLSEQPDTPGSVSWDSSMTRMFSWLVLRDVQADRQVLVINTHWDHRGPEARKQSAVQMRRFIDAHGDLPVIVTGDFNTNEDGEPYRIMVAGESAGSRPLTDGFRAVHPQRSADEVSFHGFRGGTRGSRIDWILHDDAFTCLDATIDHSNVAGKYPSDHYPVTAVLRWSK